MLHDNALKRERPNIVRVLTQLTTALYVETGMHPSIALSQILQAMELPLVQHTIVDVARFMADGVIPTPGKEISNAP